MMETSDAWKAIAILVVMAFYVALLCVKLHSAGLLSLDAMRAKLRKCKAADILLAAFILGAVCTGGSKNTNGNERASAPLQHEQQLPARDGDGLSPGDIRFTFFSADTNSVCFAVCWPLGLELPEGKLDLFAAYDLGTNVWELVGNYDIAPTETNLVDVVPLSIFPFPSKDRLFLVLGTHADLDGDGVIDARERFMYGTSPRLADTDGDGLLDGEELASVPPSDPLNHDTDGDGYPDGEELLAGSSPVLHDNGAGTTIRYYYDIDDRLTGTYSGAAAATSASTLSPAGNSSRQMSRGRNR